MQLTTEEPDIAPWRSTPAPKSSVKEIPVVVDFSPASGNEAPLIRADLPVIWSGFATTLAGLVDTAKSLTVTSADDKAGMQKARETRLALKNLRCAVENKRKELKEDVLRESQRIDSDARAIRIQIEPLEARLQEQEDFALREAARIEDENRASRAAELTPYLTGPVSADLGKISEEEYASLLADSKDLHTVRQERMRKEAEEAERAAAERAAVAEAERVERERIAAENQRLRKEAAEQEKQAAAERKAAEDLIQEERRAAARQMAAQAKEAAEKAAAAAEVAEKARLKAQEEANAERKRREDLERAQREAQAAEAQRIAEAEENNRRASLAPDAEKLRAFAEIVKGLVLPVLSDATAAVATKLETNRSNFAAWIEKQAASL